MELDPGELKRSCEYVFKFHAKEASFRYSLARCVILTASQNSKLVAYRYTAVQLWSKSAPKRAGCH